jgi:hypothetical protein
VTVLLPDASASNIRDMLGFDLSTQHSPQVHGVIQTTFIPIGEA